MRIYAGMPGQRNVTIREVEGKSLDEPLVIDFDMEGYVDLAFPKEISFNKLKTVIPGLQRSKTKKDKDKDEG